MIKEKKIFQPLTSKSVCQIYELLLADKLVSFPANQESLNKVEALISNINNQFFGVEIYPSLEEKVIAYFYFIIKNHPFVDGNKRTAVIAFALASDLNGLEIKNEYPLDSVAVFIEKIQEEDHQFVIKTLAKIMFK